MIETIEIEDSPLLNWSMIEAGKRFGNLFSDVPKFMEVEATMGAQPADSLEALRRASDADHLQRTMTIVVRPVSKSGLMA